MAMAQLSAVQVDAVKQSITFAFEGRAATREVLGRRRTEVVVSVKDVSHPDSTHVSDLSRLLLPEDALKTMAEPDFVDHAKRTAAIFQQNGLSLDWLGKLQAACTNIETRQTYSSGQNYWAQFNGFLVIIRSQYTGLQDVLADFVDFHPRNGLLLTFKENSLKLS